jgi:hypothetical protein
LVYSPEKCAEWCPDEWWLAIQLEKENNLTAYWPTASRTFIKFRGDADFKT